MARQQRAANGDTASRVLDVAERLVQHRGFNGFSYADVAAELGITKASLHYHFATKAELGYELISRYASRFGEALVDIDVTVPDAPGKLAAYADLYLGVLREDRMCLCGMLAAEHSTLPEPVRAALILFFDDNETWLAGVLEQGRSDSTLGFSGSASEAARMIVGALEGAMLIARPYGDADRFETAAGRLIQGLTSARPAGEAGTSGSPSD